MSAKTENTNQAEAQVAGADTATIAQKASSFWSTYGMPTAKFLGLIAVGAAGGFYYHKARSEKAMGDSAGANKAA